MDTLKAKADMDHELNRTLVEAGKKTEVVCLGNGTEILLLAQGGRVLGLFAADEADNFYWTNPRLRNAADARAYFESDEWQNPGGERTWLAPEVDFFFPQYPDLSHYYQPRQFDACDYAIERLGNGARMQIDFEIKHAKQEEPLQLRLSKSIEAVANPLRHEAAWQELKQVSFAGYGMRSTLELSASQPSTQPVGLWHLIQMPHGGDIYLPTYGRSEAKIVFGEIVDGDLTQVRGGGLRYRMTARGEQKISLRAAACTGRMGYLCGSGDRWQLVIRNVFMNPSGEYVDVPWTEPNDRGYGVQACNVNSRWGAFSELEYHVPAIGGPNAPLACEDFAQVWAYRGSKAEMGLIARELLGVELAGESTPG
jgi:hypothetical protein